jgi:hypothetical protein
VDKAAVSQFLVGLGLRLFFLDFETFDTAIALFGSTRPYPEGPLQRPLKNVINL